MKRAIIPILLFITLLLAACQTAETANLAASASPTAKVSAAPQVSVVTRTPTGDAPPAATPDALPGTEAPEITATLAADPQTDIRTRYTLTATLDYSWKTVDVQQHIHYTNQTGQRLSDLVLAVDANRFPGIFTLRSLQLADGEAVIGYSLDGIKLNVPLFDSLGPGDELDLYLEYDLILPQMTASEDMGPNPFGYSARQTNLTDWYPYVPVYEVGTGWLLHEPWFYGEHQALPEADFDVQLTVNTAPEGTLVAASALPLDEGQPYRYHLEAGRNFVLSISYAYLLQETEVNGVTLQSYHFITEDAAGKAAFETLVEAFTLYEELFAEYPHDSLTLVEADFNHGMEYQGLIYVSRGFYNLYEGGYDNYLTAITAHETSHQWWYGLVASDQALEPWLDESMATYSELIFFEKIHPEAVDWWWEYRVDYYEPSGFLDIRLYDSGGYRPYVNAVYLNGAHFLHEIRQTIGDADFFEFIQSYVDQYAHRIARGDDFFDLLDSTTDADTSEVLERYFQSR